MAPSFTLKFARAKSGCLVMGAVLVTAGISSAQIILPDTFPGAFDKVMRASEEGFGPIKGAPVVGLAEQKADNALLRHFQWRPVIDLPSAYSCQITQDEVVRAVTPPGGVSGIRVSVYTCIFLKPMAGESQLVAGVTAGLGPGWESRFSDNVSPRPPGETITFYKLGDWYPRVTLTTTADDRTASVTVRPPDSFRSRQGGVAPSLDNSDIAGAIARIGRSPHAPLPSVHLGSYGGPITIQNDTEWTLTVYFSGIIDRKAIIPSHGQVAVPLSAGEYKVAGELSDKSVEPFLDIRNYSGGETERFFTTPR
jgi:hypothetical protein